MNDNEVRYLLISTLLQAGAPLTFAELASEARGSGSAQIAEKDILPVLKGLVNEKLVVEGELIPGKPVPQYCWGARWQEEAQRRAASSKQKLQAVVEPTVVPDRELDVDSEPARTFHNYVINEYKPPKDKRLLVFLQCSVRRPFSTSPSHASMRRAISVATGYDPSRDFQNCPVHVVVLASKIGPVPYDLQDVYPANVRGGGVKHFDRAYYSRVKPILAERMAEYIIVHNDNYDRIATFTEGRYGEVMEEAREIVLDCCGDVEATSWSRLPSAEALCTDTACRVPTVSTFPIFPMLDGPQIIRMGRSLPRTYWEKYWIQLYLEIVSWLDPTQQAQAEERLREMDVQYYNG